MIRKISLFILIVTLIFGCGSTKKVTQTADLPSWVKTKPVSASYYIGVGSAYKTANISDYQQAAKNNALADLASEIKVNISTSSVIHKFESTLGYSEDFSAATKAKSHEQLEGYELVNTYESATHYYVYYRLSKQKYAALKAQQKNGAVQKALDFYAKAISYKTVNDYYQAISNFIKGLEAIKPYFSESLETNYQGKTIYLGNELFVGFQNTINDIYIRPVKSSVEVKKGQALTAADLTFYVQNSSAKKLAGIPIVFTLGNLPLRNSKVASDTEGKVFYQFNEVRSKADQVYFVARLDMNTLASGITFDPLFRKLIRKFDAPQGQIQIVMKKPVYFVQTSEKSFGVPLKMTPVATKLQDILASNKYPVIMDQHQADYTLMLESNTIRDKHEGRMYYVTLTGTFKVLNADQEIVMVKSLPAINGVALNYKDASKKAYANLVAYINKNLMIKLNQAMQD